MIYSATAYFSHGQGFASVPEPEIEKANVRARDPERNSHVFNLSNCSVTFKWRITHGHTEFLFECSIQHLTTDRSDRVRYRFGHLLWD